MIFPTVHIPQPPVEMNHIPFSLPKPFLDPDNPTNGGAGVSLVTPDFRHALEVLNNMGGIGNGNGITHDQNLGQILALQAISGHAWERSKKQNRK